MPRTSHIPIHTAEHQRLHDSEARRADWKNWGPYVADRAWGTVREDYSANGEAWEYFPHDHARSRTYRWNEDGIAGVCNRFQNICIALALWNERDPILKERFFGLTNSQGNHGEDVKEYYFYLDSTPTHSYMKMLYRYPQVAFPYNELVAENGRRTLDDPEFELVDAIGDALGDGRFFDIFVEYAKIDEDDILCRITAVNQGPDPAPLHILPHVWYRNNWSWGYSREKPILKAIDSPAEGVAAIRGRDRHLGQRYWYATVPGQSEPPALLFTENESNSQRLWGVPNETPTVKDSINDTIVDGEDGRLNPNLTGTKAAAHVQATIPPGEELVVFIRLSPTSQDDPFGEATAVFQQRIDEADEFFAAVGRDDLDEEAQMIERQACAGLLWSKQFYHYGIRLWLEGDPANPPPPPDRLDGRNSDWTHLYNLDVLSMPDKWEYPWYAAWDLAFHTIPLALVDPEWAKRQLILLLREWYMHPNGQLPAYEWAFDDVNPPVHAWACWRVYKLTRDVTGHADTIFLEKVFHKLLLYFTWWVNRKDTDDNNVFQGGFLGLDNIGVFDRSAPLPTGGHLEQADGTAWMGMFCLNMLAIALELAMTQPAYEDVATKFFEHFIYIADAIDHMSGRGIALWNEEDGFYYDHLHRPDARHLPIRIRSFVGLIPLFAVETLDPAVLEKLPRFKRRMNWFIENRPHLVDNIASLTEPGQDGRCLLALANRRKLERILTRMLDAGAFLSPHGLRSLSKEHDAEPYHLPVDGSTLTVRYEPAESRSGLFGGNSNWRGPVWFPLNYLMIEALQKYDFYYGDGFKCEMPAGSGNWLTLDEVADDLSRRLIAIFRQDENGRRPVFGGRDLFQTHPLWRDYLPFYEYFHGDNGAGLGASHQTGWTALVIKLIQRSA